jgi:hypothetical protein
MKGFDATEAIFFGFRLVQRDPLLLLTLTALNAVVAFASIQLMWRDLVAFMIVLQDMSQVGPAADPDEALADMGAAYGAFFGSPRVLGGFLASLLIGLISQGAILRGLVHERRGGWVLGVQLGGDELRIFVVVLVVLLITLGSYVVGVVAIAILSGVLAVIHPSLAIIFAIIAVVAGILGWALLGVRLSAAAAASVGENKFVVFGSWRLTKPRMWGLLGAFVVLFFIAIVASLIIFVLTSVLAPAATAVSQGMTDVTALDDAGAAFRSPGYILVLVLNSALNVVMLSAWSGVGAYAYRTLGADAGYANAVPPQGGSTAIV